MKRRLAVLILLSAAACALPGGPARYTYLDERGQAATAAAAACVTDPASGLSWERKTPAGLRGGDHRYLPEPPAPPLQAPACGNEIPSCRAADYVARINREGLCGHQDWRLPSEREFATLRTRGAPHGDALAIDLLAFPDTRPGFYWTRTPRRVDGVVVVAFDAAHTIQPGISLARGDSARIRLVRGPAQDDPPLPHVQPTLRVTPSIRENPAQASTDDTPRPRPAPETDLPTAELARLRDAYARYLPGASEQPHWPAPTLDDSVKAGFADLGLLPPVPFPADNPYSAAKLRLGQRLFFDPLLSRNQQIACSHCHDPATGWTDRRSVSPGHVGQLGTRNSMSILNTAYVTALFWDGRAASLEEQVGGPIANPLEMHSAPASAAARLAARADYPPLFQAAFGSPEVNGERIAQAIATFERSLISRESAFDRFLKGDRQALSDQALWGLHLFRTKARCINCHNTPLFSDNRFHSNGLHFQGRELEDLGRFHVTGRPEDKGRFRTPGLRDVIHTGNYMHNGRFPLTENVGVIAMYDAGMVRSRSAGQPPTSPEVRPLGLSLKEKQALFAFLQAISAEPRREPATETEMGITGTDGR